MGDPSKVILLEEMLRVIRDEELLDNVSRVGKKLVQGMTDLQVRVARSDYWYFIECGVICHEPTNHNLKIIFLPIAVYKCLQIMPYVIQVSMFFNSTLFWQDLIRLLSKT